MEEQLQIAEQIARDTLQISSAVSRIVREIDILREYRTRLIADAVTGKFDLRGIELTTEEIVEPAEALESAEIESEDDELIEEYADAD